MCLRRKLLTLNVLLLGSPGLRPDWLDHGLPAPEPPGGPLVLGDGQGLDGPVGVVAGGGGLLPEVEVVEGGGGGEGGEDLYPGGESRGVVGGETRPGISHNSTVRLSDQTGNK